MTNLFVARSNEPEDYWRSIILYGRNVQSYKFALASALLELKPQSGTLLKLEDLAPVYAKHIARHLSTAPKQGTSRIPAVGLIEDTGKWLKRLGGTSCPI
jgi:hypothetical protein